MPPFTEIISGLAFPEGPVCLPDGSLAFVELAAGTVSRVTRDGRKQVIATPGGSPNGAALGQDGHLYICNSGGFSWERRDGLLWPIGTPDDYSGGRIERVNLATGKVERLYDACDGHPLSGPNDIVFDAHGGFWFSDHGKRRARSVECGGLYFGKADGSLIRTAVYPLVTANGVGLSPDGREVYVAETDTGHIWAWEIAAPGEIIKPKGLLPGRHLAGPAGFKAWDSMAVTRDGRLHIASLFNGGIATIAPDGAALGFAPLPDPLTTNICFDADERHAYVTLSGSGRIVRMGWPVVA